MKWQRGHRSSHVEDRRGQPARRGLKIGGGAAIVLAIVALIAQAAGVDVSGLFKEDERAGTSTGTGTGTAAGPDPDAELVEFIHFVIDDIQKAFEAQLGGRYRWANLVIFTEEVDTRCGLSSAAIGPFYCPPDEKAYVDLSFFRVLDQRLGAGGDFAQAYVLAHEIGHHLQTILDQHGESVAQELQADCYAGVWAHSTRQRALLEHGDIEESTTAAASIGDDRLQKMAGKKVNPETWTHGSSEQRVRWFRRGFDTGDLAACDTYSAAEL